jgi:phenylpropionate dioxygenase-like ring-hydroxylating dioxygenase large terminal subunit
VPETLPWSWYADPELLRREQANVFARSWQYAARAGQVAEPGAYIATRAGQLPVVVVRGRDGELRAFVNVCRHRGSIVCEGEGRRETLQCPYHAWTYDLDGSLRAAPRSDREPGFSAEGLGLLPVAVELWGPFVFVSPEPAEPLAATLGDVPEQLAAGGVDVDALAFHHRSESTCEANWKVVAENYLECYHCAGAHPGFSRVIDVSPDAYGLRAGRWTMSQTGDPRDGAGNRIAYGQFHFVFPNTVINVMPGEPNLSIGPIVPVAPERTWRSLDYFFAPDAGDGWIADFLELDDQVGREDAALVERVQRGVRAGAIAHGHALPRSEQLVLHFDRLLRDSVGK